MLGRVIRKVCSKLEGLGLYAKRGVLARSRPGRFVIDMILLPSDLMKIFQTHRNSLGKYPNIVFPNTFNERLQRRKLTARHSRYTCWADKIRVREYVENRIGNSYLTNLYWTGTSLRELAVDSLPRKFVIKSNNGSGTIVIVEDKASFDIADADVKTKAWLEWNQSLTYAEWQYRWIAPHILVEEYLANAFGEIPTDFKFFCFRGKPRFVQLDLNRFTDHHRVFVNLNYERLPFGLIYPNQIEIPKKPDCWHEMIDVAKALACNEPFVRIDLFDINGSVRFGEITLHPEAACGRFYPASWDREIGKLI
jgi:hypothetical protein